MTDTTATHEAATLYQTLKQFGPEVRNDRRLAVPSAYSATLYDAVCASRITLDGRFEGERLAELGYRVRACSLGQATTAILVRRAAGLDAHTLTHVHTQLRAILAGDATHCDWPELEVFSLTRAIPGRRGSAELPFKVLAELFQQAGVAGATVDMDVTPTTQSPGGNEP